MATIDGGWFTRRDICRVFKISIQTILRWEKLGRLHPVRIGPCGGSVRYQRSDIEALIHKQPATPQVTVQ